MGDRVRQRLGCGGKGYPRLKDGYGSVTKIAYDHKGSNIDIYVESPGRYTIDILGYGLSDITNGAQVNGSNESLVFKQDYLAEVSVFLTYGHNTLFIPWAEAYLDSYNNNSDYVNFISVVSEDLSESDL